MADVLRVSIKGGMPNGEEWSINPVFAIGGDFGTPVSPTQANTIAIACAAVVVPAGMLATLNGTTSVNQVRVEARSLDGTLESQAEAVKASPQVGSGTASHPFQTSAVISLRTAAAGARGRGRLYWPATGMAIDASTLRMQVTAHTNLITGAKTYLSGLQTAIDATLDGISLAVWSRIGTGNTNNVTSLQVGNIFDVQRRRRDALVESYLSEVWP